MSFYRSVTLLGFGLVAVFGSSMIDLSGAGPLGCLTVGLVAAFGWRKQRQAGEKASYYIRQTSLLLALKSESKDSYVFVVTFFVMLYFMV